MLSRVDSESDRDTVHLSGENILLYNSTLVAYGLLWLAGSLAVSATLEPKSRLPYANEGQLLEILKFSRRTK